MSVLSSKKSAKTTFFCLYSTAFLNSSIFYAIATLIPLYITDSLARGGLGMEIKDGLQLYSTFFGISFLTPLAGGWLADFGLNNKSTLLIGECASLCALLMLFFFNKSFLEAALILLAIGNGFSRTALTSVAGSIASFFGRDEQKTYKTFYLFLCYGFMISSLWAGYVYSAFSFLAILKLLFLMLILSSACSQFLSFPAVQAGGPPPEKIERPCSRTLYFLIILGLSFPFFIGYVQMTTSMNLYLHHHVPRFIGSFEIPTIWINAFGSFAATSCAWGTTWLRERGGISTELRAISFGLLLLTSAFCILILTIVSPLSNTTGAILAFFFAYAIISFSDLLIRPTLFSAVHTYVSPQKKSTMMGLLYVVIGAGVKIGGMAAGKAEDYGYTLLFSFFAVFSLTFGLFVFLLERKWHKVEVTRTIEQPLFYENRTQSNQTSFEV
jgi:proton-dependent oligopeptide transporter, POT family